MAELLRSHRRHRMPVWCVSRHYLRPDGTFYQRPIGRFHAWTEDEAIWKGAHAVRSIAILSAVKERC